MDKNIKITNPLFGFLIFGSLIAFVWVSSRDIVLRLTSTIIFGGAFYYYFILKGTNKVEVDNSILSQAENKTILIGAYLYAATLVILIIIGFLGNYSLSFILLRLLHIPIFLYFGIRGLVKKVTFSIFLPVTGVLDKKHAIFAGIVYILLAIFTILTFFDGFNRFLYPFFG